MNTHAPAHPVDSHWGVKHGWQLAVIFVGGLGFCYKFMTFAKTSIEGTLLGFAVVPLLIYLLVASGFACLLGWALSGGQFSRIQESKEEMVRLELEGDDPEPLPWTEHTTLPPGARLVTSGFLVGCLAVMTWAGWVLFTPDAMSTGALTPKVTTEVPR